MLFTCVKVGETGKLITSFFALVAPVLAILAAVTAWEGTPGNPITVSAVRLINPTALLFKLLAS
ncbi:hypothetical protein FBD77_09355 [Clostridium butyricum]|nr:hypothetical protein [Clostridium butyricum]